MDFCDMVECAQRYHPEPAGSAALPVDAAAIGAPARRRVGTAHHPAPLPPERNLDLRYASKDGTRPLPVADLRFRYACVRGRQPMDPADLEQRQARGIAALEHLRTVWRARELMRADFAARQRAVALDIYGPPAREPVVVQIKRRRTA